MSWSILFIGNPDGIIKAIEKHSEQLIGHSRQEFIEVMPHLIGIVNQNSNKSAAPTLKVSASGHAYIKDGEPEYSSCQVSVENLAGELV